MNREVIEGEIVSDDGPADTGRPDAERRDREQPDGGERVSERPDGDPPDGARRDGGSAGSSLVRTGADGARGTRGSTGALGAAVVVLLLTTAGLGILLVRERTAHEEERRHLRAQAARSVQRATVLSAELAVVRAQRDKAVERLARAESEGLDPEAITAIRACVRRYAELERTPGGTPTVAQTACINAEPYLR